MRDLRGPQGREESPMKRPTNRQRHRPEEVVARLRQADEALAKGVAIAEVARSLGVSEVTLHRWRAEYGALAELSSRSVPSLPTCSPTSLIQCTPRSKPCQR